MGWQTRGAECAALAAGSSLIDGSGAPPAVTGLKAGASSVTGLRAGAFVVTPLGAVVGSVGRASLDQKTAFALGRSQRRDGRIMLMSENK